MTNMLNTIIPKSDQINADDLTGRTLTIKVTKVSLLAGEQPVSLNYEGDDGRPYKPCKSMRRVLVNVWGSDGNAYVGRSMTLYNDSKVTWGGAAVGGIRISHMSDIKEPVTMALTASKANRKPFTVKPLAVSVNLGLETLKADGEAAVAQGTASYNLWCNSRSSAEKALIKQFHPEWKVIALSMDASKEEEIVI